MDRAIRRAHAAQIKAVLQREIDKTLADDLSCPRPWRREPYYSTPERIERLIAHTFRNEGKGRTYFCGCDWCLDNKRYNWNRHLERMEQEHDELFENGWYLGDLGEGDEQDDDFVGL